MGSPTCQQDDHDGYAPEIKELYRGNRAYIANVDTELLKILAKDGQSAYLSICLFQNLIDLNILAMFHYRRAPIYAGRLFR